MKPILSAFICIKGTHLTSAEASLFKQYNPAGITLFKRNIDTPEQVKKLTDDLRTAVGREDFLIAIDQEGGLVRRFRPPYWRDYVSQQQLGSLTQQESKHAIDLHGTLISDDLHQLGININFSPVADTLHPDTTGAIASRCFSDNPQTVAEYASLLAKTYIKNGICPCMKHLPGHGLANSDSHLGLPIITADKKLIQKDFIPFQQMASFIPMGMTAHVVLPEVDDKPITQSKKGIDLIRGEIGFNGMLITDAIEMKALKGSLAEKAQFSLEAGCDLVCYCSGHDQNNPKIVAENEEVLKSSRPLSDKSLERLNIILSTINKPYIQTNTQSLAKEYEIVIQKTKSVNLKGPDNLTENWSDRIQTR